MDLTAERLGETFVAEIGGLDLREPLDDAAWDALYAAYLAEKVLVLHDQDLTPQQYYAFAERFGPAEPHTVEMYRHGQVPAITILSNRVELGRPKGIRDAGSYWHSDYSYKRVPANATLMYALEIPAAGGDTLFVDLVHAYATLPDETRERIDGLEARQQYRWSLDRTHPEGRWKLLSASEREATPEVVHPVVRTHPETGEKALFVSSAITTGIKGIEGMADGRARALLAELFAHAEQETFRFRYKWRMGDVVIWDNRAIMHRATTDVLAIDSYRTIHRINTTGTGPV